MFHGKCDNAFMVAYEDQDTFEENLHCENGVEEGFNNVWLSKIQLQFQNTSQSSDKILI